jgi:hypothetical protein
MANNVVPFNSEGFKWLNQAPKDVSFSENGSRMSVSVEPGTDWWRKPGQDSHDGKASPLALVSQVLKSLLQELPLCLISRRIKEDETLKRQ